MAKQAVLPVQRREALGTKEVRKLRRDGQVPAVLYGHKEEAVPLQCEQTVLAALIRQGAHSLIDLDVAGRHESAVVKEVQWDTFGREVLHVDFARVSKGERLKVTVPVVVRGIAAGLAEGGILDQPLHAVEVECSADNIVEQIVVKVDDLKLDESILAKSLPVPEGAKVVTAGDTVVVHVIRPAAEPEPAEQVPLAEPELIKRPAKEEEAAE